MGKGLFITGTGTDVGKTYVAGLLLKRLHSAGCSCGYYKAAMSGNIRDHNGRLIPGDAVRVKKMSGVEQDPAEMCRYVYEMAYSPHLASRLEGNPVHKSVVTEGFRAVCMKYDYVVMEGSGGILCPLDFDTEKLYLWQLIRELGLPCLVVADAGLGTINQVGLTAAFMKEKGIPAKGIILNHFHSGNIMEEDNLKMCGHLTGIPVVAVVQDGDMELRIEDAFLQSLFTEPA